LTCVASGSMCTTANSAPMWGRCRQHITRMFRRVKRPTHQMSEEGPIQTAHLRINGRNFDASMRSVQSALSIIRGASDVSVSVAEKEATIRYDPHKVLLRQFETAVRVVGCEVERLVVETPER